MTPKVYIDGVEQPGVQPGKGFFESLKAPLEAKDCITNESRLENGIRVLPTPIKYKKRDLVLEFQVVGASKSDLEGKFSDFLESLTHPQSGIIVGLSVTGINHTFNVFYTGRSPSYTGGLSGCACKLRIGLTEPSPEPID